MNGSVQTVMVCAPSQGASASMFCPANTVPSQIQAYILDATAAPGFESLFDPVDKDTAAEFFGLAFCAVVSSFLIARAVGQVLSLIRG